MTKYYLFYSKLTGNYSVGHSNRLLLCPWRKTIPLAFSSCNAHSNAPTDFKRALRNKNNKVWEIDSILIDDCKFRYPELFI